MHVAASLAVLLLPLVSGEMDIQRRQDLRTAAGAANRGGSKAVPLPVKLPVTKLPKLTGCPVANATISLPAGIAAPAGQKPVFIALGRGVQNYTCKAGAYTSNMAVATLFDASCAVGTPIFSQLTQIALTSPNPVKTGRCPSGLSRFIGDVKLGDHYFQKLTPSAASANPVFDFRATKKGDFVAVSKIAAIASPAGAGNVAWLQLGSVAGTAASTVIRYETAGGVAPTSCTTEGELLTVQYAAMYAFLE